MEWNHFNVGGDIIFKFKKIWFAFLIMNLCFTGCHLSGEAVPVTTEAQPSVVATQNAPAVLNQYTVNLEFSPKTARMTGIVKVNYTNTTDTRQTYLYFYNYLNAFSEAQKDDAPFFPEFKANVYRYGKNYGSFDVLNAFVDTEKATFEEKGTLLTIRLPEPLNKDQSVVVELNFEAKIPKICHRTGFNDSAYWFGNFIPSLCIDQTPDAAGVYVPEPYSKAGDPFFAAIANYDVSITAPLDYLVVGSGNPTVSESNEQKVTSFHETMIRDFAFAISKNFIKDSIMTNEGVEINLYHYSTLKNTKEILRMAEKGVEHFGEKIASYPYHTLNIVETELFVHNAVDYPQMIFVDSTFFHDEDIIKGITNKIGHQWFYNIIGSDQIHSAWLDESITSLLRQDIFYSKQTVRKLLRDDYDMLAKLPPSKIDTSTDTYNSWEAYYNIQYKKARIMLYCLRETMGETKFNKFLKEYYEMYAFKEATKEDFISLAEEVYGKSLKEFFKQWLFEETLPALDNGRF